MLHGSAFPYGGRSRAETEPECLPGAREEGQALTVTEHGQAVAELRPLPSPTDALGLVEEGRVVPARRLPSALPRPLRLRTGRRQVSALLDELREDSI